MDDDRPNTTPGTRPEMIPTGPAAGKSAAGASPEAEALDTFFRAARDEPDPSAAFLSAVLADAAEVSATRDAARSPGRPEERWLARVPAGEPWHTLSALLGGWRGGAALTACALIGFLIGANGYAQLATDALDTTASASVSDTVSGFYDLAALE